MHYYTAYTYLTVSNNPVLISLWKEAVPKHAFRHHFLLQGLLAVTARHKLYVDKNLSNSKELVEAADIFQQEALTTYIRLLNDITEENCHALFAFSQIVVGISYSRLSQTIGQEAKIPREFIASIVEIFELLKGALIIGTQASKWLFQGDLAAMMGPPPQKPTLEIISATGKPGIEALSALSNHIADQPVDDEGDDRGQTLLSAIQLLYTLFLEDFQPEDKLNKVVGLPIFLDSKYFNLLKACDPAALAILAYYGSALHEMRHIWVFDGIGAQIVEAVSQLVGERWAEYLTWLRVKIRDEALNPSHFRPDRALHDSTLIP